MLLGSYQDSNSLHLEAVALRTFRASPEVPAQFDSVQ